jgi:hypothetical protein
VKKTFADDALNNKPALTRGHRGLGRGAVECRWLFGGVISGTPPANHAGAGSNKLPNMRQTPQSDGKCCFGVLFDKRFKIWVVVGFIKIVI